VHQAEQEALLEDALAVGRQAVSRIASRKAAAQRREEEAR
jgi:hypothetical protein